MKMLVETLIGTREFEYHYKKPTPFTGRHTLDVKFTDGKTLWLGVLPEKGKMRDEQETRT